MQEEKTKKKKSIFKRKGFYIALIFLIPALLLALALFLMPGRQQPPTGSIDVLESVLSVQAQQGSIPESLVLGGALTESSSSRLIIAGKLELERYLVEEGDYVAEGQALATVKESSVLGAIYRLNALIEELDADIEQSASDSIDSVIRAPSAGRVKAVYAQSGESVQQTMYENSALLRLSLDGLMAVDIEARLTVGTEVLVRLSDGTELSGSVSERSKDRITVTCSDEKAPFGDRVEVYSTDGALLGSGELYIHREIKVGGYWGTVSSVYVTEGSLVSEGNPLINLKDTSFTGNRDILKERRRELEEDMALLFEILQNGAVTAPSDGRVSNLNEDALAQTLSAEGAENDEGGISLLAMPQESRAEIVLLSSQTPGSSSGTATMFHGSVTNTQNGVAEITLSDANTTTLYIYFMYFSQTPQPADSVVLTFRNNVVSDQFSDVTGLLLIPGGMGSGSSGGGTGGGTGGAGGGMGSMTGGGGAMGSGSSAAAVTEDAEEEEKEYSIGETLICNITPYDEVSIEFSVDQLDINRLSPGMKAIVTLDALPGESHEAVITSIDPNGSNDDGGSTKYTVSARMARSENMLAGMNCKLTFDLAQWEGLIIPVSAIEEREEGSFVYTGYDSENDALSGAVQVSTGWSDGENVIITDGLSAGQSVYYRYADKIQYTFTR